MKKIIFLFLSLILLTACQAKQIPNNTNAAKEDIIVNQYHFYQGAINKAEDAKEKMENINININD